MSTLAELSDELLLEIFNFVDYKDIARIAAVNRQFKAISEDDSLWHNHPNIISVLPNENEFTELMANHKVNSKNLARLRGAWNTYRFSVQQFPVPSKQLTPNRSLTSPGTIADMLLIAIISKLELFHMLDSSLASANPFKTAINVIKAQGWRSIFDGIGREIFLRVYYRTFLPRYYPSADFLIMWILNSATAFWETRTIPDRSYFRRWIQAGIFFISRQFVARKLITFLTRNRRSFLLPALIIGLVSVPFSAFTMRMLLGNQTMRETFIGAMKSAATKKLWVLPIARIVVASGGVFLRYTVLKYYYKWRYNVRLNTARKNFLKLLEDDTSS